MAQDAKRYTVTAALPYTNGPIHIGHLAGVYVPADIYVRYLRAQNKDVAFICGSDEHGVAISIRAKKKEPPRKKLLINTIPSFEILSNSLVFPLITIRELQRTFTMKLRPPFSNNCMRKMFLRCKPMSNSSTQKNKHFWPIVSSLGLVQSATTRKPMATNAKAVAARSTPLTYCNQSLPCRVKCPK